MYCYTFLQVLGEMQRRGVSRDALVSCLLEMGREMPLASVRMLQARVCLSMLNLDVLQVDWALSVLSRWFYSTTQCSPTAALV